MQRLLLAVVLLALGCMSAPSLLYAGPCEDTLVEYETETPHWREIGKFMASALRDSNGDINQCLRCLFRLTRRTLTYGTYRMMADFALGARSTFANNVYRPSLSIVKFFFAKGGPAFRGWFTLTEGDKPNVIDKELQMAYEKGSFKRGHSFPEFVGEVRPAKNLGGGLSERKAAIAKETLEIGRDGIKKVRVSSGPQLSGMSFPGISAQSKLVLMGVHTRLAAKGTQLIMNSGEGGPGFELSIISGDRAAVRRQVVEHGINTGEFKAGSYDQAFVESQVNRLFQMRDFIASKMPNGFEGLMIAAQFGGALNGIRDPVTGGIDYVALKNLAEHPNYAYTQIKLAQAAKSMAQNSKIKSISAWLRQVKANEPVKAPEIPVGFETPEGIAANVKRIRTETGKPVSLKIVIGNVKEFREWLKKLVELDGLPDHFQIDGSTPQESGGSGAFARGQAASLDIHVAGRIVHLFLQELGVRDRVVLEGSGGIKSPSDLMKMYASGMDLGSWARGALTGVGCKKMRECDAGHGCLYGVAADSFSMMALGIPMGPTLEKSTKFFEGWLELHHEQLANTGATNWVNFWREKGLYAGAENLLIRMDKTDAGLVPMAWGYSPDTLQPFLSGILSKEQVIQYGYGGVDPRGKSW